MCCSLVSSSSISRMLAANIGQSGINLADYLTLKNGQKVSDVYQKPADMVNLVVSNVFVIAGFMLFIFTILAGFKFITGGSKGMEEAKTLIGGVFTGFIVMFSAYWIIQIVQYLTGLAIL